MAIGLEDPETDRLAREVAQLTGESVDEAVRKALAERLERERRKVGPAPRSLLELAPGNALFPGAIPRRKALKTAVYHRTAVARRES